MKNLIEIKIFEKKAVSNVTKIGTVFCITEADVKCKLNNVFFSEEFPDNLLSICQLARSGFRTVFEADNTAIIVNSKNNEVVGRCQAEGPDSYRLTFNLRSDTK